MNAVISIQDAGNQFIVFARECNRLRDIIGVFDNDFNRLRILQSVLNKIVEFVDLQAMNFFFIFCKVFEIPKTAFDDSEIGLRSYFPVGNMNKASSNYTEWYKDKNGDDLEALNDTFDIDGNSSFNMNGLESEHYHMVANASQSLTAQRQQGTSDTVGMELELLYAEITRHQDIALTTWNEVTFLYYPASFEVLKSLWDHSHVTISNLLPELGAAFAAETTVTVTLGAIPGELRAWPMLESKKHHKGGCHLCTTLKEHGVVSEEEFHTITQAITPYAFATHRKELMVYFEFAPGVLQKLEKNSYNWASLRGFADSMLAKVASKDFESAYTEWMQTILRLKEEANISDSLEVLDVQLATC
tara:strand:+ start:45 stop:1121 length:1077 start_codon:yes stop_codon:yes gene_type:complete